MNITTGIADPGVVRPDSTLFRRLDDIAQRHRPSEHVFFRCLSHSDLQQTADPTHLGELLHHYQAAMHATRAMAYFLPMLDSPALRKRKLRILVEDDGLANGDTHHYQLTQAFVGLGAAPKLDDESYGDLEILAGLVDIGTAGFISAVRRLYPSSLGAWAIIELLSDDWMHALADALATSFPAIVDQPYFADCFEGHVEERHGAEALELLELVLADRPGSLDLTLRHAEEMAEQLNRLWDALHEIVPHDCPEPIAHPIGQHMRPTE